MKNQKGISIITLIVTIIVIIILATIFINNSFRENLDDTTFTKKITEMTEVYDAVVQRGVEHGIDGIMYPYVGDALSSANDSSSKIINGISYGDGYYYIHTDEQKYALNLERVADNYIVNYDTGEVISEGKVQYDGKDYHRLSDLAGAVQPGSISTSSGEYDDVQGVNAPILSEGMIPVVESSGKWVVVSSSDSSWYDYANGKYATIMLLDELSLNNYSNEQLRNMTREQIEQLAGNEVAIQGSTFIWIPRYTYKEGSKEIAYSHLLNDYTDNGYIKSPAFYFGGYTGAKTNLENNSGYVGGGKELTGIWVSKYEAGYNN